jgi:hypothetical protein
MRRLYKMIPVIFIFLLSFVSCYYDNEEALYPYLSTSCDTTNVTFSGTIVSILSNNCYSCHSNNTAAANGNGIRLENHADVAIRASGVAGAMKQIPPYSPMPKNGGKVKECSITQFDVWVRNGMPNN